MRATSGISSLSETRKRAEQLALRLRCGDVVTLAGDLGAGKTTFAQFLIQALNPSLLDITSPTFTIMQSYPVTLADGVACDLAHVDLYRIHHPSALVELGLEEALHGVTILEWPERLAGYDFPITLALSVTLAEDGTRSLTATSHDSRFKDYLA